MISLISQATRLASRIEAPAGTILGTVNLDGLENDQGVIPAQDVAFAVAHTAVTGYSLVGYTPGDTTVTFEANVFGDQEDVVVSIADAA